MILLLFTRTLFSPQVTGGRPPSGSASAATPTGSAVALKPN